MDIEIEKDQEMKTRGLPPNTTEDHFWHPVRSGFLFVFDLSFWLFPSSPSFCFPSSVLSPRPPLPAQFPVKSPPCKVQNENHQKNPFFPFFLFYPFRLRTVHVPTTIARCTYTKRYYRYRRGSVYITTYCAFLRFVCELLPAAAGGSEREERKSNFRPKRTGGPKEKKWGHEDWAFAPRERERERERPPIFIRRRRAPN